MNQELIDKRFKIIYDYNSKTNNWKNLENLTASRVIEMVLNDNWKKLFKIPEYYNGSK